jgi:hypothetical protein
LTSHPVAEGRAAAQVESNLVRDPRRRLQRGRITPDGVQARVSAQGVYDMLYNLAEDPGESRNLAATRPEVVARLKAEITEWDRGNVPAQWTSMRQAVRRHEGQMLKIYP